MKGLILCAGKGTRLQPLTYSQPKTLLPVANKPVLAYCLESLVQVGIKEIGIVLNPSQEKAIKETIGTGQQFGVQITYLYQRQPKGIADALRAAENFVDLDSFLLLLGDNLIQESLHSLKHALQEEGADGSLMLAEVENPSDYGIAELTQGQVVNLEEKPRLPTSNLAVIGAYAFTPAIFRAVKAIKPSARGEYEITDAIQWLIDQDYTISSFITKQKYSDVGNVERWLVANKWMLEELEQRNQLAQKKSVIKNCTIIPPVIIGRACQLIDSTIGPYVSIASGAKVINCQIENSILLKEASLLFVQQKITDSIFGQYSQVSGSVEQGDKLSSLDPIEFILGDKSTLRSTADPSTHHLKANYRLITKQEKDDS